MDSQKSKDLAKRFAKLEVDTKAKVDLKKVKWYLVIKTGSERKRFSAWRYAAYTNYKGEVVVSKKFEYATHLRIVPADEVLKFCKSYLRANPNVLFSAWAKDILPQNEIVPDERKINFGRYKGCDIDTIRIQDKGYFEWIVTCVKKGEYVSYKLAEYIENKYLVDVTCENGKFKKAAYEAKLIEGAEICDMVEYFMTTTNSSFLMAYKYLKEASVDMDKFIDNVAYTASIGKGVDSYLSYYAFLVPSKEGIWILYQKEIKAKGLKIQTYTGMSREDLTLCISFINQKDNALLVHFLNHDFEDFIRILVEADALWYVDENRYAVDVEERKEQSYDVYQLFPDVLVGALECCVNGGYWDIAKKLFDATKNEP